MQTYADVHGITLLQLYFQDGGGNCCSHSDVIVTLCIGNQWWAFSVALYLMFCAVLAYAASEYTSTSQPVFTAWQWSTS